MKTKLTLALLLALLVLGPAPTRAQGESCDPPDPGEPNDTPGSGPTLIVGQPQGELLLSPVGDLDHFRLWAKAGESYRVTTYTNEGVDTRLKVYDPGGAPVAENDDYTSDHPASQATFQAAGDGWYDIAVDSPAPLDWGCRRYGLSAEELAPTPTPTPTDTPVTPTPTSIPTGTPLPDPLQPDAYESNDALEDAATTGVGPPLNLNFNPWPPRNPQPDTDWFRFSVKAGDRLRLETLNLAAGLDTVLALYDQNGQPIAANDDCDGARRSCLRWEPGYDGLAYVRVSYVGLLPDPATANSRAYNLALVDLKLITPTPEPTEAPVPTAPPQSPTPVPPELQPDSYEPNWDFAHAAAIGPGEAINLNFNPWPPGHAGPDNDFFQVAVKVGDRLRFETLNLAAGLDTNLILYRDNRQVIGGNDDCTDGQRRSCLEWTADYSGPVYLLVGPVGVVPHPARPGARAYSLSILNPDRVTPTAEAEATPGYGEPVPWPVTPPVATPTVAVRVRRFSLAPPTATPRPLQSVTLDVTIYYDANDNQAPDAEEGVTGIDVRALDGVTNQVLGQAFTDRYGHTRLSVATAGEVRLSVPYLGYNQAVRPPGKEVVIRLAALQLPSLIP